MLIVRSRLLSRILFGFESYWNFFASKISSNLRKLEIYDELFYGNKQHSTDGVIRGYNYRYKHISMTETIVIIYTYIDEALKLQVKETVAVLTLESLWSVTFSIHELLPVL